MVKVFSATPIRDDEGCDDEKLCFVISSIGERGSETRISADKFLNFIVRPVVKEKNYKVVRADEINSQGIITNQIVEYLQKADLVIADLTGRNPNVYYELAIRHCFKKCVIPFKCSTEPPLPFDTQQVRTIDYDSFEYDDVMKSQEILKKQIDGLDDDCIDNPVYSALSHLNMASQIETSPSIGADVKAVLVGMMNKMDAISNDVSQLKVQHNYTKNCKDKEIRKYDLDAEYESILMKTEELNCRLKEETAELVELENEKSMNPQNHALVSAKANSIRENIKKLQVEKEATEERRRRFVHGMEIFYH